MRPEAPDAAVGAATVTSTVGASLDGGAVLDLGAQRGPEVAASGERLLDDLPAGGVVHVAEHVEVGEPQRPGEPVERPSGGSGWSSRALHPAAAGRLAVDLVEARRGCGSADRWRCRSAPTSWPPRWPRPASPTIEIRRSAQWLPVPEHHVASAHRLEVAGEGGAPRSRSCAPPTPRRRGGRRRRCRRPRGPAGSGRRRRGGGARPGSTSARRTRRAPSNTRPAAGRSTRSVIGPPT